MKRLIPRQPPWSVSMEGVPKSGCTNIVDAEIWIVSVVLVETTY
jgi:hypothetical protein